MSLRARLLRWWDAMLGRPPWYRDSNVTISRSNLYADEVPKTRAPDPGGLSLVDDEASGSKRRRRSAGIDPYSNDAGFGKPQGWDRKARD